MGIEGLKHLWSFLKQEEELWDVGGDRAGAHMGAARNFEDLVLMWAEQEDEERISVMSQKMD